MFYSILCFGFWAWLLIVVGVVLILTNLGVISAGVWAWWPIILIVIGIYILTLKKKRKKIVLHNILQKLASNDKVQEKLSKIIETIDEVVEKKIDEWHEEVTKKKDEDISGKPKV